jgi:uncharacterized protein YkwD
MSHLDPLGRDPTVRVRARGYEGRFLGEAIARGAASPGAALSALLTSAAHCRLLVSASATQAGVWVARAGRNRRDVVWVVELGDEDGGRG